MDQQRRCLTGMTNGLPITVPVNGVAPAAVIHTLDTGSANDANGRPFLDVVTLFVCNLDDTSDAEVQIFADGSPVAFALVPPGEIWTVFNETPLGGVLSAASGGGATITVLLGSGENLSSTATAWGWFVRTQG